MKPYEPVPYTAFDLPDPFGPAKIELAAKGTGPGTGGGLKPDLNRPKEPLEAYPLESLRMVGTLERAASRPSGSCGRTPGCTASGSGNYMGQNFGVITKISEAEITLRELFQDAGGDWAERESTLLLQEADAKEARK